MWGANANLAIPATVAEPELTTSRLADERGASLMHRICGLACSHWHTLRHKLQIQVYARNKNSIGNMRTRMENKMLTMSCHEKDSWCIHKFAIKKGMLASEISKEPSSKRKGFIEINKTNRIC